MGFVVRGLCQQGGCLQAVQLSRGWNLQVTQQVSGGVRVVSWRAQRSPLGEGGRLPKGRGESYPCCHDGSGD
jgi:hypothetical protein